MSKDFTKFHFKELPDGRCAILQYDRDVKDLIKDIGQDVDDVDDIKIFNSRQEANSWVNSEIFKSLT